MATFKKLLPSLIPIAVLVFTTFAPSLQALVAAHPIVTLVLTTVNTIIAHILPSAVASATK